ncbi:hypothetical protein BDZ85DRAFT_294015 [Elsinoe ampelina]|uniref:Peroxisomal ATPase PEX6 n=1 Tax=Elsinoe ampelina TaxID=302913 RepID=A0A6A6GIB6_9PEZI|nr:hypothetical protein BDZ85DRAFT_294015 [Elsinoe ampelina]
MAYNDPNPGSLKRKRRRRPDATPLSARLQLADNLGGNAAEISHDLVKDLKLINASSLEDYLYIAVREWTPPNAPTAIASRWIILPCRPSKQESNGARSLIRIPSRSRYLQTLVNSLKLNAASRTRGLPLVEVTVTDVVPLELDTIYVNIDSEALYKHDQVQKKYAGGFVTKKRSARHLNVRSQDPQANGVVEPRSDEELKQLVRQSMSKSSLIHAGDIFQLALPSHPVTHAPPPSCTISTCDPVSQGLVTETTRVVIVTSDKIPESRTKATQSPTIPFPGENLSEVEEDTSNEAFYTAAEDGNASSAPATPGKKTPSFDLSDTEDETDGNLSDDPEGMISLTSPALGSHTSGMLSSMTAATPRPFAKHMNGVHTPGSVFSSMTTATLRGGHAVRTKVLRTQGLFEKIPDELLHPKPLGHEDEEARVYVDTTILAKLGCFSGDWVEICKGTDPARTGIASLGMSAFLGRGEEEPSDSRAVKIFGLPEVLSNKSAGQYKVQGRGRSESFSSHLGISITPSVYLSPILLTNLGDPEFLRLTPMRSPEESPMGRPPGKMPPVSLPPAAKDANLIKVQSPASTDKAIDSSVFSGLVAYFEGKQRLVKTGDLIAIPIDEEVGRAVYDGSSAEDGASNDILSFFGPTAEHESSKVKASNKVVWFQVGSLGSHGNEDQEHVDVWNGLVSMVPSKTKMHQSGTEQRKVPPAMNSTWPYYEGMLSQPQPTENRASPLSRPNLTPPSNLQRRLRELISTATSPRAVHLGLPPMAILLHSTQRNIGKSYVAKQTCLDLGMHCFPLDAFDILTETASGGGDNNTVGLFESRAERALQCGAEHTCILVQHIESLNSDRMFTAIKEVLADSRVLVATTTDLDKVPENLRGLFTHELEMSAPDEAEREAILQSILAQSAVSVSPAADLAGVAIKTAALVAGDLVDVVDRAINARSTRLEELAAKASTSSPVTVRDILTAGGDASLLLPSDFDTAVDLARKNFADSIGAPKIPNVQWSDVGGLANVKEAVIETIQLPLSRPELFAKGLKKRSGILFYGPPGTGKTLLAKAIATEFSLNFFSVKGPELLNMYIGESEANVRRVFQRARDARPCVVFFDELDSVAPKRGNQGDSGGVMDRIVSQLLAELDGMSDGDEGGGAGVFVIGATNRPDLLDQALLRPGRFDKMLYLGISDTHDKQAKILGALTRKFTLSPDVDLNKVASLLPFTYTGADLYALCSDAMLKAVTRSARQVDTKIAAINADRTSCIPPKPAITVAQFFDHHAQPPDLAVEVSESDFAEAKSELVPSVSAEELGHYERVRREFEGTPTTTKQPTTTAAPNAQPIRAPTQAEVEAWQAQRIEEMIRAGMSDGSLAKGGDKGKGKGKARALAPPIASSDPRVNGSASPPVTSDSDRRTESRDSTLASDDDGDADSDFVIRTGQLNLGSNGANGASTNGADTGRVRERESRFFSRDKGKGKDKEKRGKSRTMGLFSSKGKGREREKEKEEGEGKGKGRDTREEERNGEKEKEGFGDAASDKGLYD